MEHTKEPWADDGFGQVGATGSDQFNGGYFTAICEGPEKNANAIRIAACVNACVGISTENLESNLPVKELAIRYNDCIKQRDELLEDLSGMLILYNKGLDLKIGFKVVEKTLEKFGAYPFTQD